MFNNPARDNAFFLSLLLVSQVGMAGNIGATAHVDGPRLVREAKNLILKHWKTNDTDIEIDVLKGSDGFEIPSGEVDINVQWPGGKAYTGLVSVPVVISQGGRNIRRVTLVFRTRVMKNVLMPAKSIERNETLSRDAFVAGKAEISSDPDGYLPGDFSFENKRASRRMVANFPVLRSSIEDVPAVQKGDQVSVSSKSGALEVMVRAIAKSDGAVGDRIVVTNLQSGKPMTALVRGTGDLEMVPQGSIE